MIFGFNGLNYCRKITGSGGNDKYSIGFIMFFVMYSLFFDSGSLNSLVCIPFSI